MSKVKFTNRRFYNKWLYKVTVCIPGIAIWRLYSLEKITSGAFDDARMPLYGTRVKAVRNKETIMKLGLFLSSWDRKEYGSRIEADYVDLYTNNKEFYDAAITEFDAFVKHCFEPDPNAVSILEGSKSIIVKALPHNRYKYKVFLLPHKMLDKEEKTNCVNWILSQEPRIRMSEAVATWFISTDWNWDRRYVLVEDDATLLMLKLRSASVVGRVYEHVIVDK